MNLINMNTALIEHHVLSLQKYHKGTNAHKVGEIVYTMPADAAVGHHRCRTLFNGLVDSLVHQHAVYKAKDAGQVTR